MRQTERNGEDKQLEKFLSFIFPQEEHCSPSFLTSFYPKDVTAIDMHSNAVYFITFPCCLFMCVLLLSTTVDMKKKEKKETGGIKLLSNHNMWLKLVANVQAGNALDVI